jgi:transcriptional regulator with XRE-family HTH domain
MTEITGSQVRMARAFLRWSIAELARQAGVGISTVQAIEAVDGVPAIEGGILQTLEHRRSERAESVSAIRRALEAAGVTFLRDDGRGAGVRVKSATETRRAARRA